MTLPGDQPPPPRRSLHDRPELPAGIDRPPPPAAPAGGPGLAAMRPWVPVVVFLLGAIGTVIVATIVVVVLEAGGTAVDPDSPPAAVTILGTVAQNALWVGLAFAAVRIATGDEVAARLGLRRVPAAPAIGWALLAYVGFWIGAVVIALALGQPDAEQQLVEDLRAEDDLVVLASYGILATFFAPLGEEILFRGLLYGALRERMPYGLAAVLAGSVFGLIHFDAAIQGILLLCVFGVSLCLLYQVTGSLLPCLGLHALHNAITFSYTKELPWWGFGGVVAASCLAVLAAGAAASRRRAAPR